MASLHSKIVFNILFPFSFRHRKLLKACLIKLFENESTPLSSLNYIFCSDEYLHKLNIQFLKHNTLTDVITFTLSEPAEPIIGEIYISIDRIRENALSFQTSVALELRRVIFHGALHLCGYIDKSIANKNVMTKKENEYLSLYADMFPRGTIE